MTAPDPRLEAIQARFQRALSTLAWPETPEERDAAENELTTDLSYLLAELRKAREALERVEAEASATEELAEIVIGEDLQAGLRMVARGIRAAVAATNGDGNG